MSFPTTHWSMLAEATLSGDARGRAALDRLCRDYYGPVIHFLRSRGYAVEKAADFAQEFFLQLLASRAWKRADRSRGRFRTFLLGTLMHVVNRLRTHCDAERRGGGEVLASLDELAESGFEPANVIEVGAREFDREWALQLMDTVFAKVARPFVEGGREREWEVISRFLPGAGETPAYEDAALHAGLSLPALKIAVFRVRQRFREELRAAVGRTVSAAHEIDEELAHLHRVLSSPGM